MSFRSGQTEVWDSQTLYILVHYPTRSESVAILKCNSGPQGPYIDKVIVYGSVEKPGPGALVQFFDQPGALHTELHLKGYTTAPHRAC